MWSKSIALSKRNSSKGEACGFHRKNLYQRDILYLTPDLHCQDLQQPIILSKHTNSIQQNVQRTFCPQTHLPQVQVCLCRSTQLLLFMNNLVAPLKSWLGLFLSVEGSLVSHRGLTNNRKNCSFFVTWLKKTRCYRLNPVQGVGGVYFKMMIDPLQFFSQFLSKASGLFISQTEKSQLQVRFQLMPYFLD